MHVTASINMMIMLVDYEASLHNYKHIRGYNHVSRLRHEASQYKYIRGPVVMLIKNNI